MCSGPPPGPFQNSLGQALIHSQVTHKLHTHLLLGQQHVNITIFLSAKITFNFADCVTPLLPDILFLWTGLLNVHFQYFRCCIFSPDDDWTATISVEDKSGQELGSLAKTKCCPLSQKVQEKIYKIYKWTSYQKIILDCIPDSLICHFRMQVLVIDQEWPLPLVPW